MCRPSLLSLALLLGLAAAPSARAGAFPDVRVTKASSAPAVLTGEEVSWTIRVENVGTVPATSILVTDRLPAGLERLSVSADFATCEETQPITCTIPELPVGNTVTITIVTRATMVGRITNMTNAVGREADAEPSDNTGVAFVDVTAGPDTGPPDAGPPDAGPMLRDRSDGCGCVIPAGRPPSLVAVGLFAGLCVLARRLLRSLRRCGHS